MIKWCMYCQKFQGESEPFDNYAISHGICVACESKGFEKLDAEMESSMRLAGLYQQLMVAGSTQDMPLALETMAQARREGVQNIDLLMGVIGPILWKVGDLWSSGTITVADEHRFTTFFNAIVSDMEKNDLYFQQNRKSENVAILLTIAPRNVHYFGLHSLNLWLHANNINSILSDKPCSIDTLRPQIEKLKPKFVGFSVTLFEQIPETLALCDEIQNEFGSNAPKLLLGGNAIKKSVQQQHHKGVLFLYDLNKLIDLLKPHAV